MKQHRFAVGQQVRRSRRWWPNDDQLYTIQSCEIGNDNHDRPKLAYRLVYPDMKRGMPYLESELEGV